MSNISRPDQAKAGDRVRHVYEEGTVVHSNVDEVMVHYEHGPRGTWFGSQQLVVAVYDTAWFEEHPHKLYHMPPRGDGHGVVEFGHLVDAGARLAPILQQMHEAFNDEALDGEPTHGCLAIVWPLDGSHEHYALANSVATPMLRVMVVDLLSKIDGDLRHGG